ncbi:RHS repeat protein [Pseudoxanthomonas sp. LH2527]|uniref:RHS repeat protein n=1 Tax=Pseudoxanthomonas sp. LH2527 TaxID=2923249 RepID=UPI001F140303|nr:RHS repeat protein [Pseudoxanthomonas sp. LH2527]MCH6484868.1 RHS repeat protein [Pseudoxanthomonas sp. LH2527]
MKSRLAMVAVLLAFVAVAATAQDSNKPWEEYSSLIKSREAVGALGPDLFGDQVSFSSGVLSFNATDVSVPGNSSLPVAVSRSFTAENRRGRLNDAPFADWEIELPRIEGVYAAATGWVSGSPYTPQQRCSVTTTNPAMPPGQTIDTVSFHALDYWQGPRLAIPGGSSGDLMLVRAGVPQPATGGPYYWTTSDRAHVSCLPTIQNGSGEGFLAITPDGTKYWFDWMAASQRARLQKKKQGSTHWGNDTTKYLHRNMYGLYATRVEDRFGNWVTYSYGNAAAGPVRLNSIQSSDGRSISVSYNAEGQVAQISAHGQAWNYGYSGGRLASVTLPDGSSWSFSLGTLAALAVDYYEGEPGEAYRDCLHPGEPRSPARSATVTHPSGAVGSFVLEPRRFGRTNVPRSCDGGGTPSFLGDDVSYYPVAYDHYALTSKSVSGPGLASQTWSYSYQVAYGFAPDVTSGTIQTEVLAPDGSKTRYVFGNVYRGNEGLLLRKEVITPTGVVLHQDVSTYELAESGMPYAPQVGTTVNIRTDSYTSEFIRPSKSRVITQDGATFANTVTAYDGMARAASQTQAGPSGTRTSTTEYVDEPNLWVLGSVARTTLAGVETAKTEFGWKHLPWKQYSFGRLRYTLGYETAAVGQLGTLKTAADGNGHVTTLESWKRGIPQSIRHPATPEASAGAVESAVVNDLGWITSITDESGSKTCYAHDEMGRISQITYPSESVANTFDTTTWAATTQVFQPVTVAEYGIPAGHWRQTTSTGNARKITYYDGLWRPLVTREYDAANETGTRRFQRFTYDHDGRTTFASYPGETDALTTGTWTLYDALGRPTSTSQDSELSPGLLTTTIQYLTGFQQQVTNPRGFSTVTQYQAFDVPTADYPSVITQAAGVDTSATEIHRDVFGKPLRIRKRNADGSLFVDRHYVYHANQLLCKVIEPETGATVMGHDGAGNLTHSATGLTGYGDLNHCNQAEAWASGRAVVRAYDARNRLKTLTFPDGRGNQSWEYFADGLPSKITTHNDALGAGIVENAYVYNRRRLLTGESLTQLGSYTWGMGYAYDANGSLSTQTYPSGLAISYAPNALGQATKAQSQSGQHYASGASYYPNGAIKQFTYGNGIVHSMSQNARQLPSDVVSSGGVLHDRYAYDANGNVSSILDVQNGGHLGWSLRNRYLSYDGLDRLTDAGSGSFGGDHWHRFSYNALDNMTSWKLAGVKDYASYVYDARNQLGLIRNSAGAAIVGFGYDAQGNVNNKNGQLYDFDFGNRLRASTNLESYRYDGHGRRVQAINPAQAAIRSMYGQDGVLRRQEDQRTGKNHEYVTLAGSVIARIATVVAPSVPTLSAPSYSSNGTYTVSWSATATATSYELQISANGGNWLGAYAGPQTSYAVGGQASGSYAYRVRACQASTCSGWSNTGTTTVVLPPGSAPSLSSPTSAPGGSYMVSWTAVAAASTYRLEESFNSGGWTVVQDIAAQSRNYSSRPAGSYQHRVVACNPAGCGPYSNTGTTQVIYPPAAPALSVPQASYTGSYTVSWSAAGGATSYQLEEQVNGGGWTLVYNAAGTAHGVSGKPAAVYGYRVKACNEAGCSPLSAVGSITVTLPPAAAPGISSPSSVAVSNFTVTWNGVAAATGYELLERVNGGGWNALYSGAAGSYALTGKANATYGYLVRGCNVAGCGPWSAETSTVVNVPPPIPAPPGNFTGERDVLDDVRPIRYTYFVTWSGSYGATYYELQITYGQGGTSLLNMGGTTSHQQTGGGNRSYLVRACNSNGCSAWAGPVSL